MKIGFDFLLECCLSIPDWPLSTDDSGEPNLAGSDEVDHLGTSDEVVKTATVLAEDKEGIEQSREHVDAWDLLQYQHQPTAQKNA